MHIHIVAGTAVQSTQCVGQRGDVLYVADTRSRNEVRSAVLQHPLCRATHLSPVERHRRGGSLSLHYILHRQTSRCLLQTHIIDKQCVVARRRLRSLERHIAVRAGIGSQHHSVLRICSRAVGRHILNRHKGARIGRVGHHTHNHMRVIRCRGRTQPKRHLQTCHRQHRRVGLRHDGNLVAIGAGSGIGIETHRLRATVCVAGAIIHHGVATIRRAGARIVVSPAGRQVVDRHRGGGRTRHPVEILRIRQRGNIATRGTGSDSHRLAGVGAAAVGANRESVACAGG